MKKTELDHQFEYREDKAFARRIKIDFIGISLLAISIALGILYLFSLVLS